MLTRRSVLPALAGQVAATRAWAQAYPGRPVLIVVPAAPGGTTDFTGRLLAEGLTKSLGQQFIVENRGGATGNAGTLGVARATPDGYTLLLAYSGYHVCNPALFPNPGWNPVRDFRPVGLAIKAPHVIVVRKDFPANTLPEFIAYAKANPAKVTYASSGRGSLQHIGSEQMAQLAGISMTHVPYRGTGPAMNDILAGTIDLFITTPPGAVGHIQGGSVKAFAIAAKNRHAMLPDTPTTAEAGLPGFELEAWFGLVAPAKATDAVVDRLSPAVERIVRSEEFGRRALDAGTYSSYMPPAEFGRFTETELAYWGGVISKAGIKLE